MNTVDSNNSFKPLEKIIEEASSSANALEKYTLLSSSQLNDLNQKLKKLSSEIRLLSGYNALTKEDKDNLQSFCNKVTLLQNKDRPLLNITRSLFCKNISTTISSIKEIEQTLNTQTSSETTKPLTQATWIGILAKEGREKESLETLETLSDPQLKIEAYIELIKAGKLNTIMQKVETMKIAELDKFITNLNEDSTDPHIQTALKLLPGSITLAFGEKEGIDSISKITPALQMKAALQLAKSGIINQVVIYIKNLPADKKTEFLTELQKLAEDDTAQLLLTEINLKDPSNAKSKLLIKKFFTTIRKKASAITGYHHVFSSKSPKPKIIPETTSPEMTANTTQLKESQETSKTTPLSPIETLKGALLNTTTKELHTLFFKMIGDNSITSWEKIESEGSNFSCKITLRTPIQKIASEESLSKLLGDSKVKSAKAANFYRPLKVEVSVNQTMTLSFSKGEVVNEDGSKNSYASLHFPETSQGFSFKGLPLVGELKVSEVRVYDSSGKTTIVLKKPGEEKIFTKASIDVYDNALGFWMNLHEP